MKVKGLFISIVVLWIIATGIMIHTGYIPLVKLLYFQLAVIWCPGYVLLDFMKIKLKSSISYALFSYLLGYALFLVIYALLLILNLQSISPTVFLCYSIPCAIWLVVSHFLRNGISERCASSVYSGKEAILLFLGTMVVSFLLFQIRNRPVEIVGKQEFWMDFMYWFRVCVGATKGYPVPDLSIAGLNVFWHYFSCFPVAAIHLFSGIEIYDLCFTYSCIWDMVILVAGVYVFFDELLEHKKYVIIASIILLFCSSIEHITLVSHLKFLYQCKLGCSQGLPYAMVAFLMLLKAKDNEKTFSKEFFFALLFTFVAAGLKGPYACVLLVGGCIICMLSINKKSWLKNLLISAGIVSIFLLVTLTFTLNPSSLLEEQSNSKLTLSVSDTTLHSPYVRHFYELMCTFLPSSLALCVSSLLYFCSANYLVLLIFVIGIVLAIKNRVLGNPFILALFGMSFVGAVMFMFISHPGFSQLYFIIATFPFALLLGMWMIDRYDIKNRRIIDRCIIGLISFSIICSFSFNEKDFYFCGKTAKSDAVCSTGCQEFTLEEVKGLRWVRDNLPKDIICVTNKDLSPMWRRSFVTSSFTERQMFFEASDYSSLRYSSVVADNVSLITDYFNGSQEAKQKLREKNVRYAILYKAIGKNSEMIDPLVFENRAIAVYELL